MKTEQMPKLACYLAPVQTADNMWEVVVHTSGKELPTTGDLVPWDSDMFATVYGGTKEEAEANAAHIVRCVNERDALVAALTESNELLKDIICGKHKGGTELTLCHRRIELNVAALQSPRP